MKEPPLDIIAHLLALRQVVRELDPNEPPRARYILDGPTQKPLRLALVPGSFNPPTNAHLALAEAVRATGLVDQVDFLLATRTVNKERVEGASLADRILMLEALVDRRPDLGIVLVNRGLYVEQAETITRDWPTITDLWFAVGFDKIVQIFDPRYYQDRDAALDRLFALARFFVAPRGDADFGDLEALLNRPENQRYAHGVARLNFPASYRRISSSRLRSHDLLAYGDIPDAVLQFMRDTGAYGTPPTGFAPESDERYAAREHVLNLAEEGRLAISSPSELRLAVERYQRGEIVELSSGQGGDGTGLPAPQLPRVDPT